MPFETPGSNNDALATDAELAAVASPLQSAVAALQSAVTALTAQLSTIQPVRIGVGTAATNAILLLGSTVDLTVPIAPAMPNTSYVATPVLTNSSVTVLGNLALTVKAKNLNSVVVTIKNTGLASVALGQVVEVVAQGV